MKTATGWTFVEATAGGPSTIMEAQAALLQRREALHLPAAITEAEAQQSASWHASKDRRRTETLADVLTHHPDLAATSIRVENAAPGQLLRRPSFPIPSLREIDQEPARDLDPDELHLERLEARLPDGTTVCPNGCVYTNGQRHCLRCEKRLVPVSWALLAGLIGKEGHPALGGVVTLDGSVVRGAAAVDELKRRMATYEHVVLHGESRAGKSMSAAAYANAELLGGARRLRWMSPFMLRDNATERALGAKTLILDDVGEELAGADSDTGLSAQRAAPVAEIVAALARMRGRRLVVTTFLDVYEMAKSYGGNVAARVYDGAHVICLVHA